jgi:hypothetical protein
MIKYIIIAIILNLALVTGGLPDKAVYVQIDAPAQAEAGSTVDVEIEFHKTSITGFARFRQKLPYGVTAMPVYPANMDFSFEENTLTMIWLNLPPEETIKIRYRIHIHERLKGDLQLDGTFSYIENNQRRSARATGPVLAVNPSPGIEERLIVDISDASRNLLPAAPAMDHFRDIVAIRQEPVADNDQGFIVNILVNKEGKSHFAKIEERIPEGYTAAELESHGGIFTSSGQTARIIWRNLPAESSFIVSYRLVPGEGTENLPEPDGEFTFMHNEITTSRRIAQMDVDLRTLSENEKGELIASLPREKASPQADRVSRAVSRGATAKQGPDARPGNVNGNPLLAGTGVYYRVQIAAGHRPVNIKRHFGQMKITDEVSSEIHEGWIKYSIGSYDSYRTARDRRVHIWNTTPVKDAFVAAYNDGQRITVQEALMIANHRWYR